MQAGNEGQQRGWHIRNRGGRERVVLLQADGTVVAVSPLYNSLQGAAAGITAVRENAATGLVVDTSATPV